MPWFATGMLATASIAAASLVTMVSLVTAAVSPASDPNPSPPPAVHELKLTVYDTRDPSKGETFSHQTKFASKDECEKFLAGLEGDLQHTLVVVQIMQMVSAKLGGVPVGRTLGCFPVGKDA